MKTIKKLKTKQCCTRSLRCCYDVIKGCKIAPICTSKSDFKAINHSLFECLECSKWLWVAVTRSIPYQSITERKQSGRFNYGQKFCETTWAVQTIDKLYIVQLWNFVMDGNEMCISYEEMRSTECYRKTRSWRAYGRFSSGIEVLE